MTDFTALTPGTWNVDTSHSTVGFMARHMMIAKVRGRFASFSGAITVPENPLDASVTATVDLASVDTGDEGRDAHLKGADFFDTDNFPTMTFTSIGVKEDGGDFKLVGDLTIKDVTRTVEFDLEFDGVGQDPWGGTRAAFSATAEINRKDWGLEWNVVMEKGGLLVSEKIKLNLDIEAVKA